MRAKKFCSFFLALTAVFGTSQLHAAAAPNPRSATTTNVAPQRAEGRDVRRTATTSTASTQTSSTARTATNVVSARPSATAARTATSSASATSAATARSAARQTVVATSTRPDAATSRAASSNVVRSAMSHSVASPARSASSVATISRAATARATAVFDDVSKIGGGYATCREAYSTCMDQFCAKANETYRRCYCSAKFTEFRDLENAMDQAKILLQQFEDNNLNAVDKTAAEVNAMYTATVGEQAIKNDTSGAAAMLSEISDLLSGKTKASSYNTNNSTSLGVLSFDLSTDIDDIWGSDGSDSIFSSNSVVDLAALEGQELYSSANKQCLQLITDSCENSAVLNMATSSYNILIAQDCNAYEKKVNTQKEAVQQTVRTAEKYLREARLEEYRSHNSADVNECIAKVKSALTADTACGANYKRCLDYTGAYIDQSTGEPIYSARLFQLTDLITLAGIDGSSDVLAQNPKFDSFLETRKMFATTALDSCRDISATVWEEFKRSALIEIAQAQDAKIEEVKMSCVSTMSECYDTQTSALKDFDQTTAQAAGALSAYAARSMCADKVAACAALYGGTDSCNFGADGKLTNATSCGLPALLKFVETVDSVRVAEGCATAIDNYVQELCTPSTGDMGYPWNCRTKSIGTVNDNPGSRLTDSIAANIVYFALQNCSDPTQPASDFDSLPLQTRNQVELAINNIAEELDYQLMDTCESLDGYWLDDTNTEEGTLLKAFYSTVYGGNTTYTSAGRCVENTTMIQCLNYNTDEEKVASYDLNKDECTFTDAWYKKQCESMNGYYENSMCYVAQ